MLLLKCQLVTEPLHEGNTEQTELLIGVQHLLQAPFANTGSTVDD